MKRAGVEVGEDETPLELPRWRIDPNIRLGDLLVLASVLLALTSAYYGLKSSNEQNAHDLQAFKIIQRDRDDRQDAAVNTLEVHLKENIQQIRSDTGVIREDVRELSRSIRMRGG